MAQAQARRQVGGANLTATVDVRIRKATPGDIQELERLVQRSVLGLQSRDYEGRVLGSALQHRLLAPDPHLISDGTYYVAEMEQRIVGAGGWSQRRKVVNDPGDPDNADDWLDPATEAAKIRAFYVHPDLSRMGIGSRLLHACEEAAGRAGFRRLELLSTLTGVSFYAARGWRAHERVGITLPDGQIYPTVRMDKAVDGRLRRAHAA